MGTFVLVSTDKAVKPATVMGASKALAEWAVEAAAVRYPTHQVRDGPVRQRARLVGLGGADLPPPDRGGRPGDGDRHAHEALLHDDPGGRAADHPGRLAGRAQRRGVRARDGRAGRDPRACRDDDPTCPGSSPSATSRSRSSGRDRARSSTRSCSTPTSVPSRRPHRRSCEPTASRWIRTGSSGSSARSTCWCLRGTPPALAQARAKLSDARLSRVRARYEIGVGRPGIAFGSARPPDVDWRLR